MAFDTAAGDKLYVDQYNDINLANPAMGEVVFRIDSTTAVNILASNDRDYYIINRTNPETVIYSGKFEDVAKKTSTQIITANSQLETIQGKISAAQAKLSSIQSSISAAGTTIMGGTQQNNTAMTETAAAGTSSPASNLLTAEQQAQQIISQQNQETLSQAEAAAQQAIQQAATSKIRINIVEIPGVTSNLGANPQINIKPLVKFPASPKEGYNSTNNPVKSGNTVKPKVSKDKNFDQ
jgi:hypothetical protein